MSNSYTTIVNDTFEIISRKNYGTEQEADRIKKSNPGVNEPLSVGVTIIIPDLIKGLLISPNTVTNNDIVSLLIDDKIFKFWTDIRINRSIDNIDTVEFSAPFDSDASSFRKVFKPFSFKSIDVDVSGEIIFKGVMMGVTPVLENIGKIISVSCYSKIGVLNDCTLPASLYPLEFRDMNLKDIADAIVKPFGLGVEFASNPGTPFKFESVKGDETALSFLVDLAKQKNLIITNTVSGDLLFQQSVIIGNPVANLSQGSSPVVSITPLFNPQNYYSHITGLEPVSELSDGSQVTVKNTRLLGVLRPDTFIVPDVTNGDVKAAVNAKIGRMFGNMVTYNIKVNTWRDPSDNLWKPNTTITLHAHDAMIYKNYEFVIRRVDFERNNKSESATLSVVIPGSFEGKIPGRLPWDE
jgi:prophage tail gpP-like protein